MAKLCQFCALSINQIIIQYLLKLGRKFTDDGKAPMSFKCSAQEIFELIANQRVPNRRWKAL